MQIIMDYHKFRENPPSASDHLSTVHLSDGRRYRWLTKLWCNETQTSHLCYYLPEESNVHGHAFHENTLRLAKKLHIFDHTNRYVDPEKYLKENDPVFLTAANSEFFGPVKVAIRSVQEYFPNRSIIFYDLGMNDHQVKELKSFCNLEYVRFPFEDFPGYFRHLRQYRWKPVIIAKTLVRHGAVWYMDSSVRFTTANLQTVYNLFSRTSNTSETERKFSFLLHSSAHHSIYSVTSSMSYLFLPTNTTVMKLRRPVCMEAGLSLVFRTREVIETIFVWLLACALEENCMNTPEAKLYCKFNHGHFNHYANCHRYDQAITNLLLANQLGYDTKRWSSELNYFFEIRRHQSNATFKPYTCPVSNILPNH
ncbi:hypothetical protein M514_03190 [Trichuris suis]|uniref:Nucleotide-diphospho-sugar transferase domain-containing protein n=1 Tax=Trichuris suis TaxID=68888 RepID=A0A085MFS0_9BILA|nr:hypothetical protein M513_03190 [Trichuris suis]KFD66010.1 hypothetical protein M514_03190 [Trichuris suis]